MTSPVLLCSGCDVRLSGPRALALVRAHKWDGVEARGDCPCGRDDGCDCTYDYSHLGRCLACRRRDADPERQVTLFAMDG